MKLREIEFCPLGIEEFWEEYIVKPKSVVTLQAEIAFLAQKSDSMAAQIAKADVVTADGVGLIWGLWFLGKKATKCSGVELIQQLLKVKPETPVFFFGATQENCQKAAKSYRNSGGKIVGFQDGYDFDLESVIKRIKDSGAKVAFVGMGNPAQIEIVNRITKELGITAVTVGGSFDVLSGQFKRAPKLTQKLGLEWLWRTFQDPTRFRRLGNLFGFVFYVLRERLVG